MNMLKEHQLRSLVSPFVANLYMEHFQQKHTGLPPPHRNLFRYVDDTFVIQQKASKQVFLDYINSMDPTNTIHSWR